MKFLKKAIWPAAEALLMLAILAAAASYLLSSPELF